MYINSSLLWKVSVLLWVCRENQEGLLMTRLNIFPWSSQSFHKLLSQAVNISWAYELMWDRLCYSSISFWLFLNNYTLPENNHSTSTHSLIFTFWQTLSTPPPRQHKLTQSHVTVSQDPPPFTSQATWPDPQPESVKQVTPKSRRPPYQGVYTLPSFSCRCSLPNIY